MAGSHPMSAFGSRPEVSDCRNLKQKDSRAHLLVDFLVMSYKSHAAIEGIETVFREIIPEPIEPLGDAVVFLQVAEFQYLETGNPLWIWFVVSLCSRANICPPAWAWEYMLSVGNLVTDGAIAVRRPDEKRVKYTEENLMRKLGFPKKSAGKKDRFAEFRQCITDFRLALCVRKLAFDNKAAERKNVLQACEDIAKQEKIELRTKSATNKSYVYKAYSRWFSDDGCLRLTPEVRNPR